MAGLFTLDLYTPNPRYGIPQGGVTYMPLNGDWLKSDGITRRGVVFSVSDTDTFDFGAAMPALQSAKTPWKYGDKFQSYTRKDRNFKCTVWVKGDTIALAKYGVQQLQAALSEVTQYNTAGFNNDGLGAGSGVQLFLKYQPDSTIPAVYFSITSGYVDLAKTNDQVNLLQNYMKVTLNLRISYAGFWDAVWLQNLVPNGTFTHAFYGYTYSGASAPAYNGAIPTVPGPGMFNWIIASNSISGTMYTSADDPQSSMDMAWGANLGVDNLWNSDVWSAAAYNAGNQAGTDILYTPEYCLKAVTDSFTTLTLSRIWLAFEYRDNSTANFCSAQLQVFSHWNNRYANVGPAIVPSNNTGWARYAWGSALDMNQTTDPDGGNWQYATKFRIAFSFDRNRAFNQQAMIRKIALWFWPSTLPSSMWATLPVEYVSQPVDLTEACYITSIQGNIETPVRAKLQCPQDITGTPGKMYQRAYIGARKYKKFPYKFYYSYSSNAGTAGWTAGASFGLAPANTNNTRENTILSYKIPLEDMRARQYRVLVRLATNDAVAMGISQRGSNLYGDYFIVPNGSIAELASTGGTQALLDAGVATIPPLSAQHMDDGTSIAYGPNKLPDLWFSKSTSTGTGTVTITPRGIWFLPTDQYMDIDTRQTSPPADFNSSWSDAYDQAQLGIDPRLAGSRELVIDMINRNAPAVYIGTSVELDGGAVTINAAANAQGFMFYPSTPNSPEPMQFGCVIRRQGVAGSPAADVVETDPISWAFLYMPAWEF